MRFLNLTSKLTTFFCIPTLYIFVIIVIIRDSESIILHNLFVKKLMPREFFYCADLILMQFVSEYGNIIRNGSSIITYSLFRPRRFALLRAAGFFNTSNTWRFE